MRTEEEERRRGVGESAGGGGVGGRGSWEESGGRCRRIDRRKTERKVENMVEGG